VRTFLLLIVSNIFMTFAWYGHLKYRNEALWKVIIASWGIAFFEYCTGKPHRLLRIQHGAAQDHPGSNYVDGIRVFSVTYLGEKLKRNYAVGAACLVLGVFFVFHKR
jgi:uncharacterized protein